jgi:hypothetical protein
MRRSFIVACMQFRFKRWFTLASMQFWKHLIGPRAVGWWQHVCAGFVQDEHAAA